MQFTLNYLIREFVILIGYFWLKSLRVVYKDAIPKKKAIFALWHEHLPICIPVFKERNIAVLISKSRDGELAAGLCAKWGYQIFRGSSSLGGATGIKSVARCLLDQNSPGLAGMALDGPRGPYHYIHPGTAWLSHIANIPIYMVSIYAPHAFRLPTWDKMVIPLPFSTIEVRIKHPAFGDAGFGAPRNI